MKNIYMLPCVAIAAISLAGCYAGETEEEGTSSETGQALVTPIVSQPTTSAPPDLGAALTYTPPGVRTADLQVKADFNFETSWDMDINLDLPTANSYLSLCTKYSKGDSSMPDVDFSSCIVRAPITDGTYQASAVPMTNEIEALIAVVVDYSNPSQPLFVEFPITTGQTDLTWDAGIQL